MKSLLIIFTVLFCLSAKAQLFVDSVKIDVNSRYAAAVRYFNDGQIKAVVDVLEPVLWHRLKMARVSKEARAEMFKLAAQSYIILNNSGQALKCAKQMLAYNPSYKIQSNESDLALLKNATDTLYPIPRIMLGIKYGSIYTLPKLIEPHSILFETTPTTIKQNYYKSTLSYFLGGVTAEFAIANSFSMTGDVLFARNDYSYSENLKLTGDENNLYSYQQSVNYIAIPAQLKYQFLYKTKIRPYLAAGVCYKFLIGAKKTGIYQGRDINSPNAVLLNTSDFGACLSAGTSFYFEKSCIRFDVLYNKGMIDIKDKEKRYLNDRQSDVFLYGSYDELDELKLNALHFTISYMFYLSHKVF